MIASPLARFLLVFLAVILSLPVLCIPLQDIKILEATHQRTLHGWPATGGFAKDPVQYFQKAKEWMADRAFPIVQASAFQSKFLFYVLDTPPQRRVTMGMNNFIFLNGASEDTVNGLFDSTCIRAHSEAEAKALADALPALAGFARSRNISIDVMLVPTLASLYAEYLPHSVPDVYRNACMERSKGHSPLLGIQQQAPVTVSYPLLEMIAARDEDGFFPQANWHADGLSLKTARDAYLARIGVTAKVEETLELGEGPSEIMITYGIVKNFPVYFIHNPHLQANANRNAALKQGIAHLFKPPIFPTQAFDNTNAVVPESVLMISDSFGDRAAAVFAGAFKNTMQVTTNDMDESQLIEMIDQAAKLVAIDRLILLVMEGNTSRIIKWANVLAGKPAGH